MLWVGPRALLHARQLLYVELHPNSGFQAFEHVLQVILFPRPLYFSRQTPARPLPSNLTISHDASSGSLWWSLNPASWLYIPPNLFIQRRLCIYLLAVKTCMSNRQLEIATRTNLFLFSFLISENSSATFQLPKPQIQASFLFSPFFLIQR